MVKERSTIGELEGHKMAIRNVVISENDRMMATSSFDSVKVWSIDFSS
jgi:hypothetical protein